MIPKFQLPEIETSLVNELCSLCEIIEGKLNSNIDVSQELSDFNSKVNRVPEQFEFTTYYGSASTEEFVKSLLLPVYKSETPITSEEYISLIEAIKNCRGSVMEIDYWIQILQDNLYSGIVDLIYHSDDELSANEIFEKAKITQSDSIILL